MIVNPGAVADISGGSVKYKGGYIETTKLLSSTGKLVDINDADPNERYLSVFGTVTREHPKWGENATETWNVMGSIGTGRFERGYTDGKAAGALNIISPLASWNGEVVAGSATSIYQREHPVSGGKFTINKNLTTEDLAINNQNIVFQTQQQLATIDFETGKFPTTVDNKPIDLVLPTTLTNQSGLSEIEIKTGGKFTVATDAAINMPVLSTLKASAADIDIKGSIYSAGGNITFDSGFLETDAGKLNLAAGSVLDVSGRWVNDFQKGPSAVLNEPAIIKGGAVKLTASKDLNFNKGATIKADGGAWLAADGIKLTAGDAGEIDLVAGKPDAPGLFDIPGLLHLDGVLSAYGVSNGESAGVGGELTLKAAKINLGATINETNALNLGVNNGNFDFAPMFGFSSLTLVANKDDIVVKSDTDLNLVTQTRLIDGLQTNPNADVDFAVSGQQVPRTDNQGLPSANSVADIGQIAILPEHLRSPVKLTLEGRTAATVETGSVIRTDKGSSVDITAKNLGKGIYIDGLIEAPAGEINVSLNSAASGLPFSPEQAIWLGSKAKLATKGTSRLNPVDRFGRTTGDVLPGGKVTVKADTGSVVFEQGAEVDVSGANAKLDLPVTKTTNGVQICHADYRLRCR